MAHQRALAGAADYAHVYAERRAEEAERFVKSKTAKRIAPGGVWLHESNGRPPLGRWDFGADGFVYFALSPKTHLIKIGWTTYVTDRLKNVGTKVKSKLELLVTFRGSMRDEKELHKYFAACREHGEWFRPEPPLMAYIEQLKSTLPPRR